MEAQKVSLPRVWRRLPILIFLIAIVVAAALVWYAEQHRLEDKRSGVAVLAGQASELQRNIERALSATYSLAALVRQGKGKVEHFEELAAQMLPFYPGVAALQLAPGGVIKKIVPLEGNEMAIGHNLLKDPARNKEAFLARETGNLTLAGPFNLIQGGLGAVGRLPVFLDDDEAGNKNIFWGFTTVLIRFPDVLEGTELQRLAAQGFAYELWRIHPDTGKRQVIAASSPTLRLKDPVEATLQVPNASWILGLAPAGGWSDPLDLSINIGLGFFFSLLLAYISRLMLQLRESQLGLASRVEERTRQILSAQNQLRVTLDAIPDFLFELDLDGHCYDCHLPEADLWAGPAEELIGKVVTDLFPKPAAELIISALSDADKSDYSRGKQIELKLPQGIRWFELSVSRKGNDSNTSNRFIVLARDITERKDAETAFKASEQRFRDMVNTTDGIVWEADAGSFTFTYVSNQAERLLGFPVEDWLKPGFWVEHLHPDDQAWAPDYSAACRARMEPHDLEYRIIALDGRTVWLRDIVTVVGVGGEPKWSRGIMVDITRNKWAETALLENAARFRAVTRSARDAIVTADSNGIIVGWNPSAELMFGYSEEEATGQALTMLMPERYRQRHLAGMSRVLSGSQLGEFQKTAELEGLHRSEGEFPMELSLSTWEVGGEQFFSGTIRNISERRQAENDLRIAATSFETQEGMVVTDAEGNILRVNKAFSEITGYSIEDVVGQNPRLLNSGRHDRKFFAAMWEEINNTGAWSGEVWNRRKNGETYLEWLTITAVQGNSGRVSNYVGTLTDITRRKAAEAEMQHLAFYDPLTQLPNRRLLFDRLKQALSSCARSGHEGALLFIDLDDFKTLNDTLGHDIGDLLLRQVGQRLVTCIREDDTVARLGGDEFVVMLEGLAESEKDAAVQAELVGEKILSTLNRPYRFAGRVHHSSPSIGITLFGNRRDTVEELLKRADLAMYQAKEAGRNTLRFFDPDMQGIVSARATMEADLRLGLQENQFLLHFQPQMDSARRVTGVEALVRWQHPLRGLVPPSEFIPLAETTGLILPLGHWVLESSCRQLVAWQGREGLSQLTIAVNVSARQFHHRDFVDQVMAIIEHTKAPPDQLKLELTESLLVNDVESTIKKMKQLRSVGVSFSLDDFGTGYSSLSYLKRLPLDQLKIDISFVRDVHTDPNALAIARTVIALGDTLGLAVIAEGVETEAQHASLANSGCPAFQGYLFCRPIALDALEEFVLQH